MKKLFLSLAVVAAAGSSSFMMTSCSSDDDGGKKKPTPTEDKVIVVNNDITGNVEWTNDNIYLLKSKVSVLDGATLKIQPGTIIKAEDGQGAQASTLVVSRNAKLIAEGTADKPIIFTSVQDEIKLGEFKSPNMNPETAGKWGGLIILGNAPINPEGDLKEAAIEGIVAGDSNALYGGDDANDNSGSLKYVSIRHTGTDLGEGDEIQGLTLGGVGSGTTIENIEIVGSQDDGVEIFGGTVNIKYITIWNGQDDSIDTDQNWKGTIDGFVIVNPGDTAMELDGPEGSQTPMAHTIKNGYIVSKTPVKQQIFNFDDNSAAHIMNVKVNTTGNAISKRLTAVNGDVTFTNVVVSSTINNEVLPEGITEGDVSGFNFTPYNWTWSAKLNAWK